MDKLNISRFLYFDIETVGKYKDITELKINEPKLYQLLEKKFSNKGDRERWESETIETLYERICSLIPEYGKIVCISYGRVNKNGEFVVKSSIGEEKDILLEAQKIFNDALDKKIIPSGFNILLFDLPYINKKMMKYGIRIPYNILLSDKKPWNVGVLDLSDTWRGTGRYWSSLDEVTYELGVESPKGELSGDKVHHEFWYNNNIQKIKKYCEGDVKALKNIHEKMIISLI
jgi:hypothetical protein